MRRKAAHIFSALIMLMAFFLLAPGARAIDILEVGVWSRTVDANDLILGAGSNLKSTYESNSDQGLIAISNTSGDSDNWRVDVRRSDVSWNENLVLSVKRTGNGTGAGSISGGSDYQAVSAGDSEFFSGSGNRSDIPVQLQVSGMSVTIAPATYSTSIVYTVVDTP